jgi:hypothetical protein
LPNHIGVVYGPTVSASLAAPETTVLETPLEPRSARACVRPGCTRRASTTLRFDYSERAVTLDPIGPDTEPGEYDLCFRHAARSTPPTGWTLRDRAPSSDATPEPAPPVGPDRGQGVDRLAAALSAVPWAVSEDAPDAAPVGTDRAAAPRGAARLDGLLRPSTPAAPAAPAVRAAAPAAPAAPAASEVRTVPLSERTPEVSVRPVPQPLRLVPDPTTTVWCADLLAVPEPDVAEHPEAYLDAPVDDHEVPTLFA